MREKRIKIYRSMLYLTLVAALVSMFYIYRFYIVASVPDTILLRKGREEQVSFSLPVSAEIRPQKGAAYTQENREKVVQETLSDGQGFYDTFELQTSYTERAKAGEIETPVATSLSLEAAGYDQYEMELRLFGILPIKSVRLAVVSDREVYACGMPIGIYIKTEGVLVIDTGSFQNPQSLEENPSGEILQSGDYILAVNGQSLSGKREFVKWIENCRGEELVLTILRKEEISEVKVQPKLNEEGTYKVGVWVRDSAQGIGTLTYFTGEGTFGALGHGISDTDTGQLMALGRGSIYRTDIISIRRGGEQEPGELTGILSFEEEDYLGKIQSNTAQGIFGSFSMEHMEKGEVETLYQNAELYPLALKHEVHEGEAQIYCQIDGKADYYDVEITQMRYDKEHQNQGIMLTVTDPELLAMTGGIVQGMSGSPIVQDGKIAGAITHVLVRDSTRGYGIFAENMVEG